MSNDPTLCAYCAISGRDTPATCYAPVLVQADGAIFATAEDEPACDECAAIANAYPGQEVTSCRHGGDSGSWEVGQVCVNCGGVFVRSHRDGCYWRATR